jgi:hypothetical protein
MRRFISLLKRIAAVAAASFMLMGAADARAGCGTLVTANLTDHWMWVTVYDLAKLQHLDWGWVAPHNVRGWHAGGAPTPQSYMCGSYYHVRAQVKPNTDPNPAHAVDGPDIFDTEIQINPQLSNWLAMIASVVKMGLTCAVGDEVLCAVKWGLEKGADMAAFGNESNGGVVCLVTHDNRNYWWVEGNDCANKNAKAKPPKVVMFPTTKTVAPGGSTRPNSPYRFDLYRGSAQISAQEREAGTWSTSNPKVAVMVDKNGHIRAVAPGTAKVMWTSKGESASAEVHVEKR